MKTDSHLPQFADLMSEYVNFISGIGKCDYITRIYLNSFAKYCMNHGGVLSDDIISGWASRTDKESYYTNRNRCIILRRFIRYIRSKYGAPFKLPSYPPDIKYTPKPKRILVSEQPYSYSAISHIVKKYELYKRASGKFSRRTMDKIRRFNDFCAHNYPSAEALTEEIVLDYCKKKILLSEISDNNSESFPNCWNIAQNFRKSFRRSASACRFVMVRAEYLSPGCNRCPYPTYG